MQIPATNLQASQFSFDILPAIGTIGNDFMVRYGVQHYPSI